MLTLTSVALGRVDKLHLVYVVRIQILGLSIDSTNDEVQSIDRKIHGKNGSNKG